MEKQQFVVEQLQRQADIKRIPVSEAVKTLIVSKHNKNKKFHDMFDNRNLSKPMKRMTIFSKDLCANIRVKERLKTTHSESNQTNLDAK